MTNGTGLLWLYVLMVLFNLGMLTLAIVGHMPIANIVVWAFAATMWTAAAVCRYRSRGR